MKVELTRQNERGEDEVKTIDFTHRSVLLDECIQALDVRPDGIYVDGTAGGGGHSFEIVSRLTNGGRLIAIDQDENAIAAAGQRLAPFSDRVSIPSTRSRSGPRRKRR